MYDYPKLRRFFKDTSINLVLKDNEYYVSPYGISAALKYSPISTSVIASSIDYCDSIRHEYKLYVRVSAAIKLLSRLKNVPNASQLIRWLEVICEDTSINFGYIHPNQSVKQVSLYRI
jgi:hypothetical protein